MEKYNRPRSEEFRKMLADEYLSSNISIKELSDKYATDAAYQLKKFGVKLKGRGMQKIISRKGCINYKWDASYVITEEQAYTLGFFMADGYNTGSQAGIKLKPSDTYILERMRDCFSDEIKVQKYSDYSSFVISSTSICNNLRKLGIVENKSASEKQIPELPSELMRHFIRGYFDGDGSAYVCKNGNNRYLKCNICSSTINILKEIECVLKSNGIQCSINIENRIGKEYHINESDVSIATMNMYRLFIRRKDAIKNLFHYMYDDSTICLDRKYSIFSDNIGLTDLRRHVNTELTE